jgi:hypothetical protein
VRTTNSLINRQKQPGCASRRPPLPRLLLIVIVPGLVAQKCGAGRDPEVRDDEPIVPGGLSVMVPICLPLAVTNTEWVKLVFTSNPATWKVLFTLFGDQVARLAVTGPCPRSTASADPGRHAADGR